MKRKLDVPVPFHEGRAVGQQLGSAAEGVEGQKSIPSSGMRQPHSHGGSFRLPCEIGH